MRFFFLVPSRQDGDILLPSTSSVVSAEADPCMGLLTSEPLRGSNSKRIARWVWEMLYVFYIDHSNPIRRGILILQSPPLLHVAYLSGTCQGVFCQLCFLRFTFAQKIKYYGKSNRYKN